MALYLTVFRGLLPSGDQFAHSQWFTSSADLDTVANATALHGAGSLLTTTVRGQFPLNVRWTDVRVSSVDIASGTAIAATIRSIALAGVATAASIPPQCALVVTQRTALAGRSHRGRAYLPCVAVDRMDAGGQVLTSTASAVAAGYAAFLDDMIGDTHIPVVYSRTLASTTEINAVSVDTVVDTQRRRRSSVIGVRSTSPVGA